MTNQDAARADQGIEARVDAHQDCYQYGTSPVPASGEANASVEIANLNKLLDWCKMRLRPAYREMFDKYRANPLPPRDPNEPPLVMSEASPAPAMGDEELVEAMAQGIAVAGGDNWNAANVDETLVGDSPEEMQEHYRHLALAALAVASPILTQRARDKALEEAAKVGNSVETNYAQRAALLKDGPLKEQYLAWAYGASLVAARVLALKGPRT